MFGDIAEILGMEPEALCDALADGATITGLPADAGTKLAEIEERITDLVSGEIDPTARPHRHGPRFGRSMSDDTGLDS